jgi:hypothetical protein
VHSFPRPQNFESTCLNLCNKETTQIVILLYALIFALPLFAGRDKSDVIVMNNDDRLTGEIKALNVGVLR